MRQKVNAFVLFVLRYACVISINMFHVRLTTACARVSRFSHSVCIFLGAANSTQEQKEEEENRNRDLKSYHFVKMIRLLYINRYIVEWQTFLARNIYIFMAKILFHFTKNWMKTIANAVVIETTCHFTWHFD